LSIKLEIYFPIAKKEELKRVTGLGEFFFKATDLKKLIAWYGNHLGLKTNDCGSTFLGKDKEGNNCSTQWSPFAADNEYFFPL